ncbi:MarR family winged helix-turn-helix transcriptional regulator [uncultured Dysosmobacter sp.]|uniref:MarR family winged helix-turn-helix transcriptional regulator n=1 Tax=uncultured Dysosmobacter sp. TaxID=2591384 RepID=UPI002605B222|nr:MarR family transcriptional regulator [uncultured Dysosmobacter sp.]
MDHPNALGPVLGCCAHLAKERMDARLSGYDVTPAQTHALLYLHHHGGSAPQCELTAFWKVKPSTANGILDRMEEKGLVRRTVIGSDARKRLITLTEKGEERQLLFRERFMDTERALLRGFTLEEEQTLRSLLDRIIRNLEEDRKLC